jgi:hypothetical protein
VEGSDVLRWRELGQRLARTLSQSSSPISTPARLQGLVADLAADQQELLLPLKDLVSRPAFQALIPRAGSGSGAVQRDVLIQAMEATFSRRVIQAIAEVLDGFLNLPPGSADQAGGESNVIPPPPAAQSPLPLPPSPPAPRPQPQPQPIVLPAPTATPSRRAERAPLVRPAEPRLPVLRLLLLSLATAMAVAAGAAAVVVLRTSDLCALVGLCPSPRESSNAVEALAAAEQAAYALESASNLRAYERALEKLEHNLLGLTSATLTPEQEEQRQRLDQTARDARAVQADERNDARRLEKASRALDAARESSGDERAGHLAIAGEALNAISPRSFSAPTAKELRRQLEQLAQPVPLNEPPAAGATPDSAPADAPTAESEAPTQHDPPQLPSPPPVPSAAPLPAPPTSVDNAL